MGTPLSPKGRPGQTFPLVTNFHITHLTAERIISKYPELIPKIEKLMSVKNITSLFNQLHNEFNTIVALMYQGGGEKGKSKVKYWEYRRESILDRILRNPRALMGGELNMINFSSYLFKLLLETAQGNYTNFQNALSIKKGKELKKLEFDRKITGIPYSQDYTIPQFKPSIFYKKWKLMNEDEQKNWHDRFAEYKIKEALKKSKEIIRRLKEGNKNDPPKVCPLLIVNILMLSHPSLELYLSCRKYFKLI